MPQLTVYKGSALQTEYSFRTNNIIVIGRALTNDIVLHDSARRVSRHHAALIRVTRAEGQYFIRDLGSLHATRVCGELVDRRLLRDGDVIEIADYKLVFSNHAEAKNRAGLLRVVPKKIENDVSQMATKAYPRLEGTKENTFTAERQELLEHLQKRGGGAFSLENLLDELTPIVLRVMRADRGFVRLFRDSEAQSYDDLGITGLSSGEGIEVSNNAFMDCLLEGRCVQESTTLLAPIFSRDRVLGFFCLDRRPPARPFSYEDGGFLIALGRRSTATAKRDSVTSTKAAHSEDSLDWAMQIVGKSKSVEDLLQQIREAAAGDMNVLLIGETGTGKELAAKAIHQLSPYSKGPFIAKHCGQTTESLAETEIFGYAPKSGIAGANPDGSPGWFEMANGGTLLLDEIQTLSSPMQDMFLRVLQEREVWRYGARQPSPVDLKVVAATSEVDLEAAVERGSFRKPLYYRFGIKLALPPLRDRRDDIPLLAFYFLDRCAEKLGARTRSISRRALQQLTDYEWPGNVRELENQIKKAISREKEILFSWDFCIKSADVSASETGKAPNGQLPAQAGLKCGGKELGLHTMDQVEREKIMEALEATQGNVTRASELLGYKSRQTILNKMDRYGIPRNHGDPNRSTPSS